MATVARWGFEGLVNGQWHDAHVGTQDASNTYETREEAESELSRLAEALGCEVSTVRVARIEVAS